MKLMKNLKIICVIILALSCQSLIFACSCSPYTNEFCNIVSPGHTIVSVKVTGHPDFHLMDVEVIETIHNELDDTSITILGQDGLNCGANLDGFEIDDELIVALSMILDWQTGEMMWYLEGACGLHHLRLQDETVQGQITETMTEQNYQDFKDGILNCTEDVDVNTTEILNENEVAVFPNPVNDVLNIEVENQEIKAIEIFDSNSSLLIERTELHIQNTNLNLAKLQAGIYFVRIRTNKGILTKKILKL